MKTDKQQFLEWLYGTKEDYFTLVVWNETIQSALLAIIACLMAANLFARICAFFCTRKQPPNKPDK